MANVRRPTRSAAASSLNVRGSAPSGRRSNAINKTKPPSTKKVNSRNEISSSKAPQKNSPSQRNSTKPSTLLKSHQKSTVRSPTKNSGNQKESPAKPSQRSPSARILSKGKGPSKLPASHVQERKMIPRKTVAKASPAKVAERSPFQFGSNVDSSVSTSPSVSKERVKVPAIKTLSRLLKPPSVLASDKSPSRSSPAQKRVFSSPERSPLSAKSRRLTDLMPEKKALADEDDCIILEQVAEDCGEESQPNCEEIKSKVPASFGEDFEEDDLNDSGSKSPDSEFSGKFLRRKWFSLKTRGGFTCLRSAILSPEEVANVVLEHTMVESSKQQDINFFTTKLMMRLSSRLPPTRSRPSCEELVDLTNSEKTTVKPQCSKESKGGGTAIRLKVEKRSFSDTITHVNKKPSKTIVSPKSPSKSTKQSGKSRAVTRHADGTLSKKQERELALQQLKNL